MLVYQRINLHFPMVFLWLSYGFPMGFPMVFHSRGLCQRNPIPSLPGLRQAGGPATGTQGGRAPQRSGGRGLSYGEAGLEVMGKSWGCSYDNLRYVYIIYDI